MSIKIITDSASDISPAEGERLGVAVIPMRVIIDGREYLDGVDLTAREFYSLLASSKELPRTAQPPTEDFKGAYEACSPGDDIIVITISSNLSGTMQAASIAASETEDRRIHIVDSQNAVVGERLLVMRAVQLREMGMAASEIVEALERERQEIVLLAVVDTLTYLHKGGRLSKAQAVAGGLLGIKPIVTVKDGVLAVLGKERGKGRAFKFLRDTAVGLGPIDRSRPYALAFTKDEDFLIEFRAAMGEEYAPADAVCDSIGSAVGTHVGPGAVAVAYFVRT